MSPKLDERNPIYGDEVQGFPSRCTIVKNKNNTEGVNFPLIFDKAKGFLHALSDYEYLSDKKYGISGSPMGLYFDVLPEIKFTRKNLFESLKEHPLLAAALKFTTMIHAGNLMLYRQGSPSIKEFGTNLSIHQRAQIFSSFRSIYPGHKSNIFDDIPSVEKEGAYKHFYSIPIGHTINMIKAEDIVALEKGYDPFGVKEYGPYDKVDGKYMAFK